MSDTAVGIDVGGTTIKLGLIARDGHICARRHVPYIALRSFDDVTISLAVAVRAMEAQTGLKAVSLGIAAPGHAQPGDGIMVDGTRNVPLLKDRSLAGALSERLDLPFVTVNDGSAATIGELHYGAGRGLSRFALITLGTGVGGGIAIDGRLVTGDDGIPPELGAIVLDDRLAHRERSRILLPPAASSWPTQSLAADPTACRPRSSRALLPVMARQARRSTPPAAVSPRGWGY